MSISKTVLLVSLVATIATCAAPKQQQQQQQQQQRHPVTGSLPPQGGKCRAHGIEHTYWNPAANFSDPPVPLYLNETLVPITWNFTESCPLYTASPDWGCCTHAQYKEMVNKAAILKDVLHGCPACAKAMQNLFCWYTCGPYQHFTNVAPAVLPETGQVLQTQFAVTYELSQRIWHSCENAAIGIETFKKTYEQNKIEGFFDLIVDFSPSITLSNGSSYRILGHIEIKQTCDQYAIGWNCSTAECDYSCSNSDFGSGCETVYPNCPAITAAPANYTNAPGAGSGSFTIPPGTEGPGSNNDNIKIKRATYPLPQGKLWGLPMQTVVGIILAILLGLIGLIGFINRDTFEDSEVPEEGETADGSSGNGTGDNLLRHGGSAGADGPSYVPGAARQKVVSGLSSLGSESLESFRRGGGDGDGDSSSIIAGSSSPGISANNRTAIIRSESGGDSGGSDSSNGE